MTTWAKIKLALIVTGIICLVTFFSLWRISSNNYKIEKENRENVEQMLKVSQEENNRLIAYNKQISKSIKEIEQTFSERYKSIPKDSCGDAIPSKELLEFFKQGAL